METEIKNFQNLDFGKIPHLIRPFSTVKNKDNYQDLVYVYSGPDISKQNLTLEDISIIAKHVLEAIKGLKDLGKLHNDIFLKNICYDKFKVATLIDLGNMIDGTDTSRDLKRFGYVLFLTFIKSKVLNKREYNEFISNQNTKEKQMNNFVEFLKKLYNKQLSVEEALKDPFVDRFQEIENCIAKKEGIWKKNPFITSGEISQEEKSSKIKKIDGKEKNIELRSIGI